MVRFEVFFNFPPKFASKGATGMVVAELMTRAATFWPCYPWVSDPWGSPASCLLLANFGSSIRIHLSGLASSHHRRLSFANIECLPFNCTNWITRANLTI